MNALTNWNYREKQAQEVMEKLHKSQVGIPPDFRVVLNELASNNLDLNNKGNING